MNFANALLSAIEQRRMWHHFHKDWLVQIRALLRPQLPAEYLLVVESETVLISPLDGEWHTPIELDIAVTRDLPNPNSLALQNVTAAVAEVEELCEFQTQYSLVIRRAPEQRLVAAIELISPTNKGAFGSSDREKYLRRRSLYREAGVNVLEVDALLVGEPLWPKSLSRMAEFSRHAWATTHSEGTRRFTGWGWHDIDSLPRLAWTIELEMRVLVDLEESFQQASSFNNWPTIVSITLPS